MPALEGGDRTQKAVYWESDGNNQFGQPMVKASVGIMVRWEQVNKESLDDSNNTIAINAEVVVDREMPVGSILWKGDIDTLPDPITDDDVDNLFKINGYNETPDLKGREFQREVELTKHSDKLPDTAL